MDATPELGFALVVDAMAISAELTEVERRIAEKEKLSKDLCHQCEAVDDHIAALRDLKNSLSRLSMAVEAQLICARRERSLEIKAELDS